MNDTPIPLDDPRLTAYALGELEAAEAATVAAALANDPAAQMMVEEIRALSTRLGSALATESRPAASAPTAMAATVSTEYRRVEAESGWSRVIRFPQFYFVISGAAAAAFAVMVLWRQPEFQEKARRDAWHLQLAQQKRARAAQEQATPTLMLSASRPDSELTTASADAFAMAPTLAPDSHGPLVAARPTDLAASVSPRRETSPSRTGAGIAVGGLEPDFVTARQFPQSTFPLDPGSASYGLLRRLIREGQLPPPEAVRIAELLHHFPFHDPAPVGVGPNRETPPVAATIEVSQAPWAPTHRLVRIGLKAREMEQAARPNANLVFLVDVSDSMGDPSKLSLVKSGLRQLVGKLRSDDRIAIVTYPGGPGLALPSTSGSQVGAILAAIDGLQPGQPADGGRRLEEAYGLATGHLGRAGNGRVVLCTDGEFDVAVPDQAGLLELVAEKARSGVALSVLAFGRGAERDAALETLAARGTGTHGYVETDREAGKLLAEQVNGVAATVARDVRIQVEFNPAKVASYRLISDEAARRDVRRPGPAEPKTLGSGDAVTALYEIVPAAESDPSDSDDALRYQVRPAQPNLPAAIAEELLTVKVRYRDEAAAEKRLEFPATDAGAGFETASGDFKFAAAVAQFGMLLRRSPHRGAGTMDNVIDWAAAGATDDPGGLRREFVDLARRAQTLWR